MKTDTAVVHLLSAYQAADFNIEQTELFFNLSPSATQVKSRLKIDRKTQDEAKPLVLDGVGLTIETLAIDGQLLSPADYEYDQQHLLIKQVPNSFVFESSVIIDPQSNTRFEGLYISSNNFCTQCEAQGFRHITFYFDRPDVMSIFTTTITASKSKYPILLSNGHLTDTQIQGDIQTCVWHDPYKKPAYLFALVAGNLACVEGSFTTLSGREVALKFYTEEHNKHHCDHALRSLQKAMLWDEQTFGLEYDLDLYMVVAVDDFNMGAMENKGLNVFNTKYVLASQETATDQDYINIESVIGHEYFHNWTGNRVTCRDWFQLSLKEGLTVFRDQEFSSDLNSRGIQRINDVCTLRTHQFAEDASPMAHPVRPSQYQQINNFYTATVYNKGAEVVRMYHTLLGKDGFRKGMDLYFKRFDGQAVTTDDFRMAMQDATGINLDQFQRWYDQSGTPHVQLSRSHDAETNTLTLTLTQHSGATKEKQNLAFQIPVRCALFNQQGDCITLADGSSETILNMTETSQEFTFEHVEAECIVSAFRGFSAPVKISTDLSTHEKLVLLAHDDDAFNRWDATQQIASDIILGFMTSGESGLLSPYIHAIEKLLNDLDFDPALCAELIQLPSEKYIAELVDEIDPHAIHHAREQLKMQMATQLHPCLLACYQRTNNVGAEFSLTPQAMGLRALNNACLAYLAVADDQDALTLCQQHYNSSNNMTDRMGAVSAIKNSSSDIKQNLMSDFYQRFEHDNLVIDKWFNLQAVAVTDEGLGAIKKLLEHPAFTLKNPNRARSLITTFAHSGSVIFHQTDGQGYDVVMQQLLKLDRLNPQVCARLAGALIHWRKMVEPLRLQLKQRIELILAHEDLSQDVREILQSSME